LPPPPEFKEPRAPKPEKAPDKTLEKAPEKAPEKALEKTPEKVPETPGKPAGAAGE
jgi:fused signal recognition particle receptor